MNVKIKIGAYAVLLILAAGFGWAFHSSYAAVSKEAADAAANDVPAAVTTNTPAADSNSVAATNQDATTTNTPAVTAAPTPPPAPAKHPAQGKMIAYLAALIGSLIGLGILIAYDVTQVVGGAAVDALLDDRGEGLRSPEYENAEQVWANGKFLEAIQLMREFLKNNPREQYAALRIAEIYEKDLNNFLAAALEYEEILKKKLPAERWGWSAIHLCNLYSKLGQQDKTRALLQRIADDYPKTGAAKKARSRLGIAEPEPEPAARHEAPEPEGEALDEITPPAAKREAAPPPEEPPPPPEPKSNLPPGFRPKK